MKKVKPVASTFAGTLTYCLKAALNTAIHKKLLRKSELSVRLVNPLQLIRATAHYLKENNIVTPPKWAPFVKTGVSKDRPPSDPDWWYIRCAAILRKLYVYRDGLGVSRLRKMYGGRIRMGHRNPHFAPGSGSVIRKALQQLEAAGLLQKSKKGRVLTRKGSKLLEEIGETLLRRQQQQSG